MTARSCPSSSSRPQVSQRAVGRVPSGRRAARTRYFDDDFEDAAKRCFKCGGAGHMARDCPNAEVPKPCFLCARFGHDRANCPNRAP